MQRVTRAFSYQFAGNLFARPRVELKFTGIEILMYCTAFIVNAALHARPCA